MNSTIGSIFVDLYNIIEKDNIYRIRVFMLISGNSFSYSADFLQMHSNPY